jgi:hypothetical protein
MSVPLAILSGKVYSSPVTDKEVTEFSSSNNESAQAAQCGVFVCVHLRDPSMGGDGREAARLAGVLSCRSANPAICRPPHLAVRSGLTATKEATMPNIVHVKAAPQTNIPPTPELIQAAAVAYDMATLGQTCVNEICTFLSALTIMTRDLTGENVVIHDLAKLGLAHAQGHYDLLELECKEKNTHLHALLLGAEHA